MNIKEKPPTWPTISDNLFKYLQKGTSNPEPGAVVSNGDQFKTAQVFLSEPCAVVINGNQSKTARVFLSQNPVQW